MTVHELLDMPWFNEWLASQKAVPANDNMGEVNPYWGCPL